MKRWMTGASVAALAALAGAAPALAQDADAVEEIVVSALKRVENVQDIPKTVEVLGQETLSRANITRLADLSRLSTSLQATDVNGRGAASLTVRGVSSFNSSYGLVNKVGIVIDDVPLHSNATLSNEITDIERVEILPGPQSTLSGRNSTAGLINMVTRGPSETFTGNFSTTYTNDQEARSNLFVSGPLTETLAASLSAYTVNVRGLQKNTATGDYSGRHVDGVRAKLRWRPTDRATVMLTGYYQNSQVDLSAAAMTYVAPGTYAGIDPLRRPYLTWFPGLEVSDDNVDFSQPRGFFTKPREWGGILRVDYDLNAVTLSSITSFYRMIARTESSSIAYFDRFQINGDTIAPTALAQLKDSIESNIQEFRVASNSEGRLTYLAGFIYDDSSHRFFTNRPVFAWPHDDRDNGAETKALYGTATYELLPKLQLTTGLRRQWNNISYYWAFLPVPIRPTEPPPSQGSSKAAYWSGDASLKYYMTPNFMMFASYAQADQGEVWDIELRAEARAGAKISPLESERVRNYETGFKSTLFDGKLLFNVTAFNSVFTNYQIRSTRLTGNPNDPPRLQILSLGRVQSKGVEFSGAYLPTDRLRLNFGLAYTDAKIKDFPNSQCYVGQPYDLTPPYDNHFCNPGDNGRTDNFAGDDVIANLTGGKMPNAPEWRANLDGSYEWQLEHLDIQARAAYRYRSSYITDVRQDPLTRQRALGVVDMSVRFASKDGRYGAEVFVNNVTDADTRERSFDLGIPGTNSAGGVVAFKSVPRDYQRYYGIRLTAEF